MHQNGSVPVPGERGGDLQFRDLVNLVRRNLWIILGSTAAVVGITAYATWTAPPIYEASTTIHVDSDRPATPEFAFITEMLRVSDVDTEMALLRARSLAEATVDSLHLQVGVDRPAGLRRGDVFSDVSASRITRGNRYEFERVDDGEAFTITDTRGRQIGTLAPGEAIVFNGVRLVLSERSAEEDPLPGTFRIQTHDFQEAVEGLLQSMSVGRPFREASVMSVSHQGTDPGLVREVPNVLANIYMDRRSASKKTEAVSTVAFLEEQIADHQTRLRAAEEARLAFQQGEQVVDLQAEGAEQVRQLVEAEASKRDLESQLASLTTVLDDISSRERRPGGRSPYRVLAGFPTFLENQAVTQLLTELNRIEADRTAQLELRTSAHPDVVAMDGQIAQLEEQLYQLALNHQQSLLAQTSSAEDRLTQFGQQLERIPENSVQLERLNRELSVLEEIFTTLQTRLQEARVAQAVEPGDVRVVDPAIEPTRPIRPRKVRSMILALLFGLVLGITVAAARDHMDERVHSREHLAQATELPILAMIPRIPRALSNGRRALPSMAGDGGAAANRLVAKADRGSPVSEAYRAFRTNITFLNVDKPPQTVLVTSPGPSEGKSTCASNLAITLAQQDTKTLLIDCDLRRGVIHKILGGTEKEPGLTNVLKRDATLDEAVRRVEVQPGKVLHYLSTGTLPPNPSELLGSHNMKTLVEALRAHYEVILFDSPPLNLVTDAAVLGTIVDSVILIARAGNTHQGALRFAREQLTAVKAPVSGVVLNDVDLTGRGRYYGNGSGYGYYRRYYKTLEEA